MRSHVQRAAAALALLLLAPLPHPFSQGPVAATGLEGGDDASVLPATHREQLFLAWLRQQGGSFDAITLGRSAEGVRGVFAARDIEPGEVLAAVPHRLMLKLPYSENDDYCEQGEALMRALLQREGQHAQHAQHFDVLPTREESEASPDVYHLPRAYWGLLGSDVAQQFLLNQRMALLQYWRQHRARLAPLGGSLELLRYSLWLAASRTFSFNETHFSLVPLVDMTNHVNGCETRHSDGPCPSDAREPCFIIRAGAPIASGREVCNAYGYLRNDEALLHYGFNLDEQHATELLCVVDMPDASMHALAGVGYRATTRPPPFAGDAGELAAELARLRARLRELEAGEPAAARAAADAKADPGGLKLQHLLRWRRLRQAALRAEVQRLQGLLEAAGDAGGAGADAGADAGGPQGRDEL